ncbi:MAG: CPBP family intramembrane metalloprotease [Clostridia bacterium]|nr:CPBP family intramembrane metalloprotease [Clostridia bacterium]
MTQEFQTPFGYMEPEQNPYYKSSQRQNLARIGFGLLTYLLVTAFLQTALILTVSVISPAFYQSDAFQWILQIVPQYCVGFPIFCLFLFKMPKKAPAKQPLGKENWFTFLAVAFLLAFFGNLISIFLMAFFEALRGAEITNALNTYIEELPPLLTFVTIVVIAPILEELMFRKLIIDRLLPYSEMLAVVTSGLFFGLIHQNFYQFFYATLLGLLFGLVYVKTGKIWHSILMHMIINFTGSVISSFFFEVTSEEAILESSINPWLMVSGIYNMANYVLIGCGLALLIRKWKEITLEKTGECTLSTGTQFKLAWCNAGTICFGVLCALSFVANLFI